MGIHELAEHISEISCEGKVAAFIQLLVFKAWPLPIDLSAPHASAHDKHDVGLAVIGATVAIFFGGAFMLRALLKVPGDFWWDLRQENKQLSFAVRMLV